MPRLTNVELGQVPLQGGADCHEDRHLRDDTTNSIGGH
jgi:hypothetical protein